MWDIDEGKLHVNYTVGSKLVFGSYCVSYDSGQSIVRATRAFTALPILPTIDNLLTVSIPAWRRQERRKRSVEGGHYLEFRTMIMFTCTDLALYIRIHIYVLHHVLVMYCGQASPFINTC